MENYVDVELALDDDVIKFLRDESEKRGISLDDLVNEILKEELEKYEKKIWKEDLIEKIDEVLDDISKHKVKYFVYDYEDLQKPVAVLLSIEEYNHMKETISKC